MKPKVILIIAILLGLITSGTVYFMMDNAQQKPVKKPQISVVIAKQDIQSRETIKESMVQIKKVPKEMMHPQAFKKISEVVGQPVLKKIIAGEQVLKPRILNKKQLSSELAFNLDDHQRAVTIAINEVIGVAGFLTPGDYVDIVGVFSNNSGDQTLSKTILQNIKVLAVAQDMVNDENQKPKVTKSITLAVDLDNAEKLILADAKGDIRLALRSVQNQSREVSSGVELDEMLGQKLGRDESTSEVTNRESKAKEPKPVEPKIVKKTSKQNSDKEVKGEKVEVIRGTEKSHVIVPPQ
ncbi:Flp pilus assembly protein CpaB [Selenihalanaerobacter shriftii]|uniref:Pilus assembly protein CpaB n=1 Tax=Selenihalanaerobacter shriftii TaxID=142842 RepID=A0A1T4KQ86_9FIRM|nr:Flp pilus assembly protein CpaB [Selenihalanaerobacter shriftii]SJZ44575.1 pilus assembly protein CpaB [Selenihalanaerobacter shriftii]